MDSRLPVAGRIAGWIAFGRYGSGEIAFVIRAGPSLDYGPVICKPTVSLVRYGAEDPGPTGCWIKTWSENAGVLEELEASGVVVRTGKVARLVSGRVTDAETEQGVIAAHVELTPGAVAELQRQEGSNGGR